MMSRFFHRIKKTFLPKQQRAVLAIEQYTAELEYLLVGINYQTTFEFVSLGKAKNLDEADVLFKKAFPKAEDLQKVAKPIELNRFWNCIDTGLEYRGNTSSGIKTNEAYEKAISKTAQAYKSALNKSIDTNSQLFEYRSDIGIPDYPVFWAFRLLFTYQDNWYFIYGSASD